jgi:DNA-binding beta-propeller fold protein YncE
MSGTIRNRKLARPFGVMMLVWALIAALVFIAAQSANTSNASPGDAQKAAKPGKRPILAVSNNWDGTVDLVNPRTFKRLKRINVVPDRAERTAAIMADPIDAAFFLAIRQQVGEGHDQFADDAFTSPNGRRLYVSRPSFADVVAIDMGTGKIIWRVPVDGQRSDHMDISRDGKRLLVSASTANVVHVINTAKGKIVASFESGDSPHENTFSEDERRIYHASIGRVYTPDDDPETPAKGKRFFQIVDGRTYKIIKRIDMGEALERAGYPDMSSAIRPMTLSPDERFVYFQVSFFHGFVEYDLKRFRVRRVINLPRTHSRGVEREDYLLDSAHHGIAMNPLGKKICVAGTMDDYAAVVSRKTGAAKILQFPAGAKPYWVTPSANGRLCFISLSGLDRVAVINYRKRKVVGSFRVGDHPQRMRTGWVRRSFVR